MQVRGCKTAGLTGVVAQMASVPLVGDPAMVCGFIFERSQTVEVADRQVLYGVRIVSQPQVHGDPSASVVLRSDAAPPCHAAAGGAEVKFDFPVAPDVMCCRARGGDAFIDPIIRPERAIAAADCAVAGGGGLRITCKGPVNRAAVA